MSSANELLERWQAAGLVTAEQAGRIRDYEQQRHQPAPERPGALEALVYVGVAIVCVGAAVLVGSNWEHLGAWARIAVLAVPGVLGLLAGVGMLRNAYPQVRRAASLTWLAALALLTGAVAVSGYHAGVEGDNLLLLTAAVALPLALLLWAGQPAHLQVAGIAAAVVLLGIALAARVADRNMLLTWGVTAAAFGAAGIALAERGWMTPRTTVRVFGAMGVAFGAWYAGLHEDGPALAEVLVFLAAAALVVLSLWRGVFVYMAFGVAALFFGLISTVLRHVDDPTAASLALILIGVALIGAVLLLTTTKPWTHMHPA